MMTIYYYIYDAHAVFGHGGGGPELQIEKVLRINKR